MFVPKSRRHWREQMLAQLEAEDPAHSRWLQEHPRRSDILNELVTDAVDMWCQAMTCREDPNYPAGFGWNRLDPDELEATVIQRTLETPELWPDLAETHPRTPKPVKDPPFGPAPLDLIPPTGPPKRRSPRPD